LKSIVFSMALSCCPSRASSEGSDSFHD
jgi:hypothetical protein